MYELVKNIPDSAVAYYGNGFACNLHTATQEQLKVLHDMGHPWIKKVEKKDKGQQ